MIRIVGIQRSDDSRSEFVVLQNQGNMRVNLRGHALLSQSILDEGVGRAYVLRDDVDLPAGHYCVVRTGRGEAKWCHRHEGYHIYHAFLHEPAPIWGSAEGAVMLLAPQHTYAERSIERLLV